jgi:hypothetical protein
MILGLHGFPVLEYLNEARSSVFNASHDNQGPSLEKFASWMTHKALTVISLPANLAAVGLAGGGMVVAAGTLGVFKVAVFAATLGHKKLDIPTGFIWCAERGINAGAHFAINLGELIYDAGNAVYLGYRLIRWIGHKLNLDDFFKEIFNKLGQLFEYIGREIIEPTFRFVATRLKKGVEKAAEDEGDFKFSGETPALIRPLDNLTKKNRIDWQSNDRYWNTIFKHYFLSFANIPANGLTAMVAGGASIILSSAFVAKVVLYAATNINIPVPTYAGQAINATYASTRNIFADVGTDVCDGFVLIYKTSNAIGISRVVATALQVLLYIPEAIFS